MPKRARAARICDDVITIRIPLSYSSMQLKNGFSDALYINKAVLHANLTDPSPGRSSFTILAGGGTHLNSNDAA